MRSASLPVDNLPRSLTGRLGEPSPGWGIRASTVINRFFPGTPRPPSPRFLRSRHHNESSNILLQLGNITFPRPRSAGSALC